MPEDAPVIFFDILETWAVSAGIGHLDLAITLVETGTTPAKTKNVSVAHLRFPLAILPALKRAIEQIELVEKPAAGKA
jgi:hypothetical protein